MTMPNKINVFIDTNIFLSLYDFSTDTLSSLEELVIYLKNDKVKIYLTEQVVNEFWRNRENKIKQGIDEFKKFTAKTKFSNLEKSHEKFEELNTALNSFKIIHSDILSNLEEKTSSQQLPADILISELFINSSVIKITDNIIKIAKNRYDLGNPPGKNNSYGDAINWEILLNASSLRFQKLYFVTNDNDYISILDKQKINPFLLQEWKVKTHGEIEICNNFNKFFKLSHINIIVKEEQEKTNLILDLKNSNTFSTTHLLIRKMSKYMFNAQEKKEIFEIALSNSQVSLIGSDEDVSSFICNLMEDIWFVDIEFEEGGIVDKLLDGFDPNKNIIKSDLNHMPF